MRRERFHLVVCTGKHIAPSDWPG